MPKFVIEHEVPGAGNLTDAQLREMSQKSVSVLRDMGPEIQWLHSYVTGDKVYCIYLAPDEATIFGRAAIAATWASVIGRSYREIWTSGRPSTKARANPISSRRSR